MAMEQGTDFTIWGSGAPLRQFIYSHDLAELIVWTVRSYHSPEPIILSVGEEDEVAIGDVARAVAKAMDYKGDVVVRAPSPPPRVRACGMHHSNTSFTRPNPHPQIIPGTPRRQFDTAKADGQFKKTASNVKLRGFLPDYKFTPIEEGLAQTCKWFKENYATARK